MTSKYSIVIWQRICNWSNNFNNLRIWNKHETHYLIFSIILVSCLIKLRTKRIYSLFLFLVIYTFRNLLQFLLENFNYTRSEELRMEKVQKFGNSRWINCFNYPFRSNCKSNAFFDLHFQALHFFPGWILCSLFFQMLLNLQKLGGRIKLRC